MLIRVIKVIEISSPAMIPLDLAAALIKNPPSAPGALCIAVLAGRHWSVAHRSIGHSLHGASAMFSKMDFCEHIGEKTSRTIAGNLRPRASW